MPSPVVNKGYTPSSMQQERQRQQQALQRQYAQAQQGGYSQQWAQRNAPQVEASGGYYTGQDQRTAQQGVMGAQQAQAPQHFQQTAGNAVNYGGINAYESNPYARAIMQQYGMAPQYGQVTLSQNGRTQAQSGNSNMTPQQLQGAAMSGTDDYARAEWLRRMRQGTPLEGQHGPTYSQPFYQAPGAGRSGAAMGMAGGGAGGGLPSGLSQGQASGLAGGIERALGQELSGQSGMPIQGMYSQLADARGSETQRQLDSIREDFGRRGQTGTAGEAAALREASERASGANRNDYRDLMTQDRLAALQRRLQAASTGSSFLTGQSGTQQDQLRTLLSLFGAV